MSNITTGPVPNKPKTSGLVKFLACLVSVTLFTKLFGSIEAGMWTTILGGIFFFAVLPAVDKTTRGNHPKLNAPLKKSTLGVVLSIAFIGTLALSVHMSGMFDTTPSVRATQPVTPPTPPTPEEIAAQKEKVKKEAAELAAYYKTPAGKFCLKHPGWTQEECEGTIERKIWIGMPYEALVYQRGRPNHINPSNYGSGVQYQYCWSEWTPSCFYDQNDDGLIDSYN